MNECLVESPVFLMSVIHQSVQVSTAERTRRWTMLSMTCMFRNETR